MIIQLYENDREIENLYQASNLKFKIKNDI